MRGARRGGTVGRRAGPSSIGRPLRRTAPPLWSRTGELPRGAARPGSFLVGGEAASRLCREVDERRPFRDAVCGVIHRGEVPPTGGKLGRVGCCASGT